MRNVLFAVGLVAASFAGGAVVNGPGLAWAKAAVLSQLAGDGDEHGDLPVVPSNSDIPGKPIPPLVLGPSVGGAGAAGNKTVAVPDAPFRPTAAAPSAADKPPGSDPELPGLAPVAEGSLPVMEAPTPSLPAPDVGRDAKAVEAPRDEPRAQAVVPVVEPPAPLTAVAPSPASGSPVRLVSMASEGKAAAPAEAGAGDWAEVRRQLRALGVSRYGLEGDPSGRVRFHCVIPLAGKRAVSQHFEAEADDDLQAARVALKRVTLWRATAGNDSAP